MSIIRNNLNSRILIQLKGGQSVGLLEKSTVEIKDDDLTSSHLQDLIQKGFVTKEKKAKNEVEKEVGKEGKLENPNKEKVSKKEIDEDLSKEKEVKNKTDEDFNRVEKPKNDMKQETEAEKGLCKEKEVKTEVDEKSGQEKVA